MSNDWDVISNAIKHAVGLATNPGWELGSVIEDLVTGDGPFTRTVPGEPRPASPSTPLGTPLSGGALPPASEPLQPPPVGLSSGAAAEASHAAADQVKALIADLAELDKNAAATVETIHAAGQAGAQALDAIQKGVEEKIAELGPRLETPAGQQELRNYLTEKLTAAKTVLETQMAEAEDSARKTQDLTHKYAELANAAGGSTGGASPAAASTGGGESSPGGDGSAGAGGSVPVDAPSGGGEPGQSTPPPAAATPTTAATQPAGLMPAMGMMPGGMGMPSIPIPSLGGMPGIGGGGDPLGALSGLSGLGAHDTPAADGAFHDDASADGSDPSAGAPKLHEDSAARESDATQAGHTDGGLHEDAGTQPAAAEHGEGAGRNDAGSGQSSSSSEAGGDHSTPSASGLETGTHLTLPDGTTTDARNDASAAAVRAALNGTPVADAYRQAGVDLPPPGTPVTDPLPPTQLKAGDIGVWKDHMVMALGGGKVLVSGQVQPQSSVGSGPDFLGWINPTAHAHGATDQPATPAAAPSVSNPPASSPGAPA
jgi:hypothetical protein